MVSVYVGWGGAAATGAATETMEMTRASRPSMAAVMEVRLAFLKFARRSNPVCTYRNNIFIDYEIISSIPAIRIRYSDSVMRRTAVLPDRLEPLGPGPVKRREVRSTRQALSQPDPTAWSPEGRERLLPNRQESERRERADGGNAERAA
jgi:hypothetical protein